MTIETASEPAQTEIERVSVRVKADEFGKALKAVIPFAEDNGFRPALSCIRIRLHKSGAIVTAANPYTMAEVSVPFAGVVGDHVRDVFLSRETATLLARTIRDVTRSAMFGKKNRDGVLELREADDISVAIQVLAEHEAQSPSLVFTASDRPLSGGTYPRTEDVKPRDDAPRTDTPSIAIAPRLMQMFVDAAKALVEPGEWNQLGFIFYGPISPIDVRIGTAFHGVVMPVRIAL